jgi:hypothetical protein
MFEHLLQVKVGYFLKMIEINETYSFLTESIHSQLGIWIRFSGVRRLTLSCWMQIRFE